MSKLGEQGTDFGAIDRAVSFSVRSKPRRGVKQIRQDVETFAQVIAMADQMIAEGAGARLLAITAAGETIPVPEAYPAERKALARIFTNRANATKAAQRETEARGLTIEAVEIEDGGFALKAAAQPAAGAESDRAPWDLDRAQWDDEVEPAGAGEAPTAEAAQSNEGDRAAATEQLAAEKPARRPIVRKATVAAIEAARQGTLPTPPNFEKPTHKRWRKRLAEVVALAEAGDVEGLRTATSPSYSSSCKGDRPLPGLRGRRDRGAGGGAGLIERRRRRGRRRWLAGNLGRRSRLYRSRVSIEASTSNSQISTSSGIKCPWVRR